MRYMIIVKATRDSEAGANPTPELFARMAVYELEDFEPNESLEVFKRLPGNGRRPR